MAVFPQPIFFAKTGLLSFNILGIIKNSKTVTNSESAKLQNKVV
jgi:hypothetical protein